MINGLPSPWTVTLDDEGVAPKPPALWISRYAVQPAWASTSIAFWRKKLEPWGRAAPPSPHEPLEIVLPHYPSLDDMLTLYLLSAWSRGEALPPASEALCQYAADVRQGLFPDRVPPSHALQSVYLALLERNLVDAGDPGTFVEDALALCAHAVAKLAAGARLLEADLFADAHAFQRYVNLLEGDQQRFAEDVARAKAYSAIVPARETSPERMLPLLVIDRPVATQFKIWARRDAKAPGGNGWPLLLVSDGKDILLTADPQSRAQVGFAAEAISAAEKAARGGEEARWYDGARHGFTLVAPPRGGTKLTLDEVVEAIQPVFKLRRIETRGKAPGSGRTSQVAVMVAAALMIAGAAGVVISRGTGRADAADTSRGQPTTPITVCRGARCDDADDDRVEPGKNYALIFASSKYDPRKGWPVLANPLNDAKAIKALLESRYGFEVELVQDATRRAMQDTIARYVEHKTFGAGDQLLVYFAGHGDFSDSYSNGYVIPTDAEAGHSERDGIPFDQLQRELDAIKCPHLLLALDVCYGGTFDERVRGVSIADRTELAQERGGNLDVVKLALKYRSRLFISSVGKRPAKDGAPGQLSPFAQAWIDALKDPGSRVFVSAYDLRSSLMDAASRDGNERMQPVMGGFAHSRPESDFFFIPRAAP